MFFETNLVDHPLNKRNFEDLRNSFDRKSFVPFVGAGPSTPMGEPDWEDLFKKLKMHFGVRINRINRDNGTLDYPKMFSNLFKKVPDKSQFFKILFQKLEPTKTRATNLHYSLVELFDTYLTTNYDSPIEVAFERLNKKTRLTKHYFACYDLNDLNNCVIYLHGHKDINFGIIKLEDYEYFYPTVSKKYGIPILEDFLSRIFISKTLVFVGFSFVDYYFCEYLIYLDQTTTLDIRHFSLLGDSSEVYRECRSKEDEYIKVGDKKNADKVVSEFFDGPYGIRPVVYKESHVVIEDLFDEFNRTIPSTVTSEELGSIPVR